MPRRGQAIEILRACARAPDSEFLEPGPKNLEFSYSLQVIYALSKIREPFLHHILSQTWSYYISKQDDTIWNKLSCGKQKSEKRGAYRKKMSFYFLIWLSFWKEGLADMLGTHTNTHTHAHLPRYMCIYVCVLFMRVYMCAWFALCVIVLVKCMKMTQSHSNTTFPMVCRKSSRPCWEILCSYYQGFLRRGIFCKILLI